MRSFKKLLPLLIIIVLIGVGVAGFVYRQDVYDWWRLRSYEPSPRIVALADDTKMSDEGRRLYYVAWPELNNKQEFNQNCPAPEYSIVLGCYITFDNIYIYDVKDKRLDGVHEVTAAHEMLHVAYQRLDEQEKQRVDALTEEAFSKLSNQRIKNTIKQYRDNDPSVVPNELHSILGTEVANLPAELEKYYAQYFDDRSAVVKFSSKYESKFESRQAQIAQLDKQIKSLKAQIEDNKTELSAKKAQIDSERSELDRLRQTNPTAYNARVAGFNALIDDYNAIVSQSQSLIARHNQLVEQVNDLAFEIRDLYEALDSTPQKL